MPNHTQDNRPMRVTTPLGKDALLLVGFSGTESLSQLYSYQLSVLAQEGAKLDFSKLLGKKVSVTIELDDEGTKTRFFSGVCRRVREVGEKNLFGVYSLEVVPQFWMLTRKTQSRTFQHLSVPDILKKVLAGLNVTYEIQGTFEPRDYCSQYRESDFGFASRLMEEEGIFYFFRHAGGGETMVVANTPQSHADVPHENAIRFQPIEGGMRDQRCIDLWEKSQELRSGKVTLWDHCFELPHKHVEADKVIQDSVALGDVTHKLKVGGNDALELYDYPGGYAQRFDGIDKAGGEQPSKLQKIFDDNKRTAEIRMQEEAVAGISISGGSACRQLVPGHKFTLSEHANANGAYVLTSVTHRAELPGHYISGEGSGFHYQNLFTCIPLALPFRPARTTPRPSIQGTQTAVVVGKAGEEIDTDKYGRVKVQFHWDREGKNDLGSSCWVRVATAWAGKQWGMIHIPRVGQEVVVGFEEGDIDRPIVLGSVYNADTMPPYALPDNKTQSGIKTRSSQRGDPENFNEICFEDKKGEELLYIRAEKDQTIAVENDEAHWVGHDRLKTVDNDETVLVHGNRTESVDKNETIAIGGNRTERVDKDETIAIKGNRTETVDKDESITLGKNRTVSVGANDSLTVAKVLKIDAGDEITLKSGSASIVLKKDGSITISGSKINVKASGDVTLKGSKIAQN